MVATTAATVMAETLAMTTLSGCIRCVVRLAVCTILEFAYLQKCGISKKA
jgi:hypothetical protein